VANALNLRPHPLECNAHRSDPCA